MEENYGKQDNPTEKLKRGSNRTTKFLAEGKKIKESIDDFIKTAKEIFEKGDTPYLRMEIKVTYDVVIDPETCEKYFSRLQNQGKIVSIEFSPQGSDAARVNETYKKNRKTTKVNNKKNQ